MTNQEFENIFRENFTFLRNTAFSVVHDDATAKDMVQQVFLNLWTKRSEIIIKGSIKSYLQRAVINTAINHIRKNKKLNLVDDLSQIDAFNKHDNKEEKAAVLMKGIKKGMEALPPKCRLVFSLSRFSEMSNREIAEHLNISIKSVEKHMGKALKELRISLRPLYKNELLIFILLWVGLLKQYVSLF